MEYVRPDTLLRWQSKEFGPLRIIRDHHPTDSDRHRLTVKNALGTEMGSLTYYYNRPQKRLIYADKFNIPERNRTHGIAGSLLTLLPRIEGKPIFINATELAEEKDIYRKMGFRDSYLIQNGKRIYGLRLDRASQLKPQDWEVKAVQDWNTTHPNEQPRKAVRKFFIEKKGSDTETAGPKWRNGKIVQRWQSDALGKLNVVCEQHPHEDMTFRFRVEDEKGETHAHLTYFPHAPGNEVNYLSDIGAKDGSRRNALPMALVRLALEKTGKPLFVRPWDLAKKVDYYRQIGMRPGYIMLQGKRYYGRIIDKPEEVKKTPVKGKKVTRQLEDQIKVIGG